MNRSLSAGALIIALLSACSTPAAPKPEPFAGGQLSLGTGDIIFDKPICADEYLHTGTRGPVEARLTPKSELWAGSITAPIFYHQSADGCPKGSIEFRTVYSSGFFHP